MNKGPEVNADGIVTMQATFDYEKANVTSYAMLKPSSKRKPK